MPVTTIGFTTDDFGLELKSNYAFERLEAEHDWPKFDRISTNENQLNDLADILLDSKYFSSSTLLNPSIPEFTLIFEEKDRPEHTYICFRRSIMKPADFETKEMNGVKTKLTPLIDAYVYINNKGSNCNVVVTLCRCENFFPGNKRMSSSTQIVTYHDDDPWTALQMTDVKYFAEFLRSVKISYFAVQMLSAERPSIFANAPVTQKDTVELVKRKHKNKYRKIHKTRLIRTVSITDDIVSSVTPQNPRLITCPCWGVAGHTRTYKSGRQIWIKPYRKGRDRLNSEAYEPKEYQIPIKEVVTQ